MENNPTNEIRARRGREPFMPESDSMTMMEAVKSVFNKYAEFGGRARRSEYWYFQLFNLCVTMGTLALMGVFAAMEALVMIVVMYGVLILYSLAIIIPSLAVISRRLHDTGRSGWMYLLSFIPLVGPILLLVFFCEDSKPGVNQWGPNPKGIGNTFDNREQEAFKSI